MTDPRHFRIFLSSPGDVGDERSIAGQVIEQLPYDPMLRGRVTFEVVAWDKPGAGTPMLATMTPQAAIDAKLPKPSECDIVVVIFWARMGTPLDYKGKTYLSGTHYEYEDAIQAARQVGRPEVVIYRRTEEIALKPTDKDFLKRYEQWQLVDNFFVQFTDPTSGKILGGYNLYKSPEDFRRDFEMHLKMLIKGLIEAPVTDSTKPPITYPLWQGSPFPGLRAFTPEDAPIFFGRGQKVDALTQFVKENHITAVVGASGSGKSSLVGAGLIPRLMGNAIEGSKDWVWLRFTPGAVSENPFAALAAKLESFLVRAGWNAPKLRDSLSRDPATFHEIINQVLVEKPTWSELLLFIDQFEELFTLVDKKYQSSFVNLLSQIAASNRARAVLTMRSDFYQHCVAYPELEELLVRSTFPLSAPRSFSLREMIERPAERAALTFDEGLPEQLVTDTGSDPGALALMAYTLDELYQLRGEDGKLTYAHYEKLGGVQGAIGTRAEKIFNELSTEAQVALPRVFERLLEVDENGTATRERAPLSLFNSDPDAEALINAFIEARLLTTAKNRDDIPTVEVAHEALFRNWQRLTNWIEETQSDHILLRQVRHAAKQWDKSGFNPVYLWPDERLKPVYQMLERLKHKLDTDEEIAFIRPEADRILEEIRACRPGITHQQLSAYGDRLSMIGDPRPGVGLRPDGIPDISWCFVPRGEIILDDGAGEFKVEPFFIAEYPITYVQYQAFLDDSFGFANNDWWKELAYPKQPIQQQNVLYSSYPRDNMSWFQAVAFTCWLTAKLKNEKILSTDGSSRTIGDDCVIRLPTEWEWQQAATGGDTYREYPWGQWDGMKANTKQSGLNRTVSVGMYPLGASPVGALDMCGNVFEWCLNQFEDAGVTDITGHEKRVVRGGSFYNDPDFTTVHYRTLQIPDLLQFNFGFRICAARKL